MFRQEILRKKDLKVYNKRQYTYLDGDIDYIERRNQILEMRKAGNTYAQIGATLGITRQRVERILNNEQPKHSLKKVVREVRIPILQQYMTKNSLDTFDLYVELPVTVNESYHNFVQMLDGSMYLTYEVQKGLLYLFDLGDEITNKDLYYEDVVTKGKNYKCFNDDKVEKYLRRYNITFRTFVIDVFGDDSLYQVIYAELQKKTFSDKYADLKEKIDAYIDSCPVDLNV